MRQWRFNPISYGVLNMDGTFTIGVIEIRLLMLPDSQYRCVLTMSPPPVGRPESIITAPPSDNKNGAMRNLMEIIDRFPVFEGKIT